MERERRIGSWDYLVRELLLEAVRSRERKSLIHGQWGGAGSKQETKANVGLCSCQMYMSPQTKGNWPMSPFTCAIVSPIISTLRRQNNTCWIYKTNMYEFFFLNKKSSMCLSMCLHSFLSSTWKMSSRDKGIIIIIKLFFLGRFLWRFIQNKCIS